MAEEIMEQSENKVMQSLAVLNGVSTTITSYMNHQNSMVEMNHGYVYPPGFVTLTDAEHHFQVARNVTGALVIGYLPRIEPQHLGLWKNFSFAYQGWIAESNQVQEFEPILTDIWEYAPENERRRSLSTCDAIVGGPARRRLQTELKEEEMMRNEMEEHAMDTPQDPDDTRVPLEAKEGPFSPVWTLSPPPPPDDTFIVNYNLMDKPVYKKAVDFIEFTRKPTFLDVCNQAAWFGNQDHKDILQTVVAYPVFSDFMEEAPIVGHVATIIPWKVFFQDILSAGSEPVHVVLTNTCEETFTFEVHGHKATLLSDKSDVHKTLYDDMVQTGNFAEYANPPELKEAGLGQHCVYTISVYPTPALEEFHKTQEPMWYALIVLGAFVLTAVTFMVFDYLVQRKQAKVVSTALKQNAIVSSLFPKNIQAKMMAEIGQAEKKKLTTVGKAGLKRYLDNGQEARKGGNDNKVDKTKPIADLFPETTIMFADIAGYVTALYICRWDIYQEPKELSFLTCCCCCCCCCCFCCFDFHTDSPPGVRQENRVPFLLCWKPFIMNLMLLPSAEEYSRSK